MTIGKNVSTFHGCANLKRNAKYLCISWMEIFWLTSANSSSKHSAYWTANTSCFQH